MKKHFSFSIEAVIGAIIGITIANVFIPPVFDPIFKIKQPQIEICKTDTLVVCKSFVPYQVISVDSGRTLFSGDSIYYSEFIDTFDIRLMTTIQAQRAIRREILDTLYIPNIYITHEGRRFRVQLDPEDI